jgi:hypothetical protein
MTYNINKTDGSLLAEIVDSSVDTTATDLSLIGKNVTGYGQFINENFVKLLENFSSTAAPGNPITGQIWFDLTENRLKVYDGNSFKIASGPIVSPNAPLSPSQGDFWIDSKENQLYFYDGVDRQLAGPIFKDSQGISGFQVDTINDVFGNQKTITRLWNGANLLGIFSHYPEFTPAATIGNFTGSIKPGFNATNIPGFKFNVTASSAEALIDSQGNFTTVDNFLISTGSNSTIGTLSIVNPIPLILGVNQQSTIRVSNDLTEIQNNVPNQDFYISVRNSLSVKEEAVTIKTENRSVGIFNPNPSEDAMLHIGKPFAGTGGVPPANVIIEGNLTVNGTTTSINSSTITVDDKTIELASTANPSDTLADQGGIILKGTTDHSILWSNATDSWNLSEHVNLLTGKEFKINGSTVLTSTSLGNSILSSSLTSLGTLENLQVDNINLNSNTISSIANELILAPASYVSLSNKRIADLGDPRPKPLDSEEEDLGQQDAATRKYVDESKDIWRIINSSTLAAAGDKLLVDTSAGSITATLPLVTPVIGESRYVVKFADYAATFDDDSLIIARYRKIDTASLGGTAETAGTYLNVPTVAVTGTGSGLTLNITVSATGTYSAITTSLTPVASGINYHTGDSIKVLGTQLGGTTPENDLVFDLDALDNILGQPDDLIVSSVNSAFGLVYTSPGQGWVYTETLSFPNVISADIIGNLTGDVTGNVSGNVTGNVSGNVTGNLFGLVKTPAQPDITSVGTLTDLTVSGTITGDLSGNVTGQLYGNVTGSAVISATSLNLEAQLGSVGIVVDDRPVLTATVANTEIYGNVEIINTAEISSSFRLPNYTIAQRDARTPLFGEMIYNVNTRKVQVFVEIDGWVDLH